MSETRSVETTAADIETAIEIGLAQLDVARESVIVEILEEPSRGILGLGARQARIRLTTAAPPRYQAPPAATPEPEPEPAPAPAAAEPRPAPARPAPQARREEPEEEEQEDRAAPVPEDELDDDARVGRATLQELLGKMKIRAEVVVARRAAEGEQAPWVLRSAGVTWLADRRRVTLAALQYITRLIAVMSLSAAPTLFDVEGYGAARRCCVARRCAWPIRPFKPAALSRWSRCRCTSAASFN